MSRRSTRIASQPTMTLYNRDGSIRKVNREDDFKMNYAPAIKFHLDEIDKCRNFRTKMHHVNACFTVAISRPDILSKHLRFTRIICAKALELIPTVPASFTRTHVTLNRAVEVTAEIADL